MFPFTQNLRRIPVSTKALLNLPVWLLLAAVTAGLVWGDPASPSDVKQTVPEYGRTPLSFQPNVGQMAPEVQFQSQGPGYRLSLKAGEAVLRLERQGQASGSVSADTLTMRLLGASEAPATGQEQLPGIVNYFIGNDPARWHTGIPTYAKVSSAGVYSGIDLVFYGNQRQLEYDFVVNPGADPARIAWQIDGAKPRRADDGSLELAAPGGPVRFLAPVAYQTIRGKRCAVASAFRVSGDTVRFELGSYDRQQALVIDPVLSYFSYLGGNGSDFIGANTLTGGVAFEPTKAVGIDSLGDLYVAGSTTSTDFPVAAAALHETTKQSSESWAFVSKFNPTGTKLLYSTYIGGSTGGSDTAYGLAVDSAGNAYVTGDAGTNDFPVTAGAFQTICAPTRDNNTGKPVPTCTFNTGNGNYSLNAFVLKLNPTGSALVYSTFLGGYTVAHGLAIAVDAAGQAYVTGSATAGLCGGVAYEYGAQYMCFPTTSNALISDIGGGNSIDMAYLSVFNSTGTKLVYSTLFGDSQGAVSVKGAGCQTDCGAVTYGGSIALDPLGNVLIGGRTVSSHLVLTKGAYNTTGSGANPGAPTLLAASGGYGYVAKFKALTAAGATSLIFSTYFGGGTGVGGGGDVGGVAGDATGNVYVTGMTHAADFPATKGAFQTQCDVNEPATFCNLDGYVAKLNPTGTALTWATYLGSGSDAPIGGLGPIAVDAAENVYVMGTGTGKLPVGGTSVSTLNGNPTAYVAKLNATGTGVLSGVVIGEAGAGAEQAGGMAVDSAGDIYVGGSIEAGTSLATAGAFQPAFAGGQWDSFVAKVTLEPTATTLTLSAASAIVGQKVTFSAAVAGTVQKTPVPTGTVKLTSGTTLLGTITLGAAGTGTFSTTSLGVGTYSVTATYSGDNEYKTSTSTAHALVVQKETPKVSVVSSHNPSIYGVSVTFTATAAPTTATGTMTFKNGTVTLGSVALSAGIAKFTTAGLIPGAHAITASYGGNATYNAVTSTALTQTVEKITPTLKVTSLPVVYNGVAHAATVVGSVAGTVSSIRYSGSATVPIKAGTYAITANFVPSNTADYSSLTAAAAGSFVISKATPTIKVTNSPVVYNGAAHAATVVGSVAGTASKILYSGLATVPIKAGTYAIKATFVPTDTVDYNSLTAAAAGNFVISKATPMIKVTNSPVVYNGAAHAATVVGSVAGTASKILYSGLATVPIKAGTYAIKATFVPTDTVDYNSLIAAAAGNFVISKATPTIKVTNSPVVYNGVAHAATVVGSVAGTASKILYSGLATVPIKAGTYAIKATFVPTDAVDYNSLTAAAADNFVISKATPVVTLASSLNPSKHGNAVTFTAKIATSATGTITFKNGTTALGVVTLSGGAAKIATSTLATGKHTITAVYAGDANDNAATSTTVTQTVN